MSRRVLAMLCLCVLLLSSCGAGSTASVQVTPDVDQAGNNLPSPTTQALPGLLRTEQLLLMTPHPARDLFSLAQRFKGYVPPAHPAKSTPLNEQVGQEQNFWVFNQDSSTYQQVRARLVYLTAHVYMYVEDGQPFNQAALQTSADTFEAQIYPTNLAQFGDAWTPLNGDPHLTILNAVGLGQNAGGSFEAKDEYPSSVSPYSNQREMFYMNLDSEIPGSADYTSALANELQRLIGWHEQALAPSWFNEGMAVLAQRLNTYSAGGADVAFLQHPDTQLTSWPGDVKLDAAHAGASYLFMDYFAEHYGGYGVLKEVLRDPAPPPTNFDDVLAKRGYSERFIDVVGKWMVANAVADPSIDVGEYGYPSIHLASGATPQQVINAYPAQESGQVDQYAADYYDLHPSNSRRGTLNIQLSGSPTVRLIGNDPQGSANEWWGNRADNLDSTLTHSFDLSSLRGQHVTLQFATWFDLQTARDYAYVEVSTDGNHWTTLPGSSTTTDNASGLNLGNGYTGVSGNGTTPTWTQESVDLSAYAGKKVQLRFEEVTDGAVHLQGFALDQIRIPELNFQDDLNTDNGWVSAGFVRSNNILPEHYLVQAIVYRGSHVSVQTMKVDLGAGQGALAISQFGNQVTRVILVVAAYAPETTLQAHYHLQVSTT